MVTDNGPNKSGNNYVVHCIWVGEIVLFLQVLTGRFPLLFGQRHVPALSGVVSFSCA